MAKYIVNHCFGGYGWSNNALREISARKGKRIDYDSAWDSELRDDPVAIAVLEQYGSKWCSAGFANLAIEQYDEDLFIPEIEEYDGSETLKLIPRVTESRIRACNSVDEIVDFLRRTNVLIAE